MTEPLRELRFRGLGVSEGISKKARRAEVPTVFGIGDFHRFAIEISRAVVDCFCAAEKRVHRRYAGQWVIANPVIRPAGKKHEQSEIQPRIFHH